MPRRTPLEAFINGQTDRQAAYEKRRREAGFTKACAWVPSDRADEFKALARTWCEEREGGRLPLDQPTQPGPEFYRAPSGQLWVVFVGDDGKRVMVPTIGAQPLGDSWEPVSTPVR